MTVLSLLVMANIFLNAEDIIKAVEEVEEGRRTAQCPSLCLPEPHPPVSLGSEDLMRGSIGCPSQTLHASPH